MALETIASIIFQSIRAYSEEICERRGFDLPLQTFETEVLAEEENFGSLAHINRELIAKAEALDSPQPVVLDMDSTEIPV